MINPYAVMYDARMSLYRYELKQNGNLAASKKKLMRENIPCRLSISSQTVLQAPMAAVRNNQKIFCGLDIDIREGDRVVVTLRTGKQLELVIGECHPYTYQWQCEARRDDNA